MKGYMASAIHYDHDPEPPDDNCTYREMKYEQFRLETLAQLANDSFTNFSPFHLVKDGYFRTSEGWLECYDCGLHCGLGHHKKCMADLCNVPVALTNTKMKEERDGVEAVTGGTQNGLITLRTHVQLRGLTNPAAVQPSRRGMELSHMHSINSPRRERRRNVMEEAGFDIVGRNSVRCPGCHAVIALEKLPLNPLNGLDYVRRKHADVSPTCSARPSRN